MARKRTGGGEIEREQDVVDTRPVRGGVGRKTQPLGVPVPRAQRITQQIVARSRPYVQVAAVTSVVVLCWMQPSANTIVAGIAAVAAIVAASNLKRR